MVACASSHSMPQSNGAANVSAASDSCYSTIEVILLSISHIIKFIYFYFIKFRSSQCSLYLKFEEDDEGKEIIGNNSCVTLFIKSLILLLEHGAKAHLRHLSEFFGLLYEFSRMGEEETLFLLKINIIRSVADFYLGNKSSSDCVSILLILK